MESFSISIGVKSNILRNPLGHVPFVLIPSKTPWLDAINFHDCVACDDSSEPARFGNGSSTGDFVKRTSAQGYSSLRPDVNTLGYVG